MTPEMRVKRVEGCDYKGIFKGIEILLADPETQETLLLEHMIDIYETDSCRTLFMGDNEFIQTVKV